MVTSINKSAISVFFVTLSKANTGLVVIIASEGDSLHDEEMLLEDPLC